jgi:hypothetical protein
MTVPFDPVAGSVSVTTSEVSLLSGTTTLQASTVAGKFGLLLDVSAMAAGTILQVRYVSKVNGGTAGDVIKFYPNGLQGSQVLVQPIALYDGWDIRLKIFQGATTTIGYAISEDVGNVNVSSITAAAINAAAFAGNAITAAAINAGAITSNAFAAGAITASAIASVAITAAKFASDAIDSNALAASAVTKIQSGLALAATALSTAVWTNTRAANLDNLTLSLTTVNNNVSSVGTQVTGVQADTDDIQTRLPTALDGSGNMKAAVQSVVAGAVTSIQAGLATTAAVSGVSTQVTAVAAQVTGVQADTDDIQTRLPASLDAGNIKASVQSVAAGAVTSIQAGLATAGNVSGVSTQIIAVQADTTTLTGRVDVAVSTRAPLSTAVSNVDLTPTRAGNLDRLDVATSTREPAGAAASVGTSVLSAITGVQSDTDNIQTRLPTALDGSGNMKASVQSLVSGAISSIAVGVMASIVETGFDVTAVLQLMSSALAGVLAGLSTNNPVFKSLTGLKNRITATTSADGRPTVTYDLS